MKSLSKWAFAAALALSAVGAGSLGHADQPPSASPAPASDYTQFRQLAKPLRVLDELAGWQHDLARSAAPMKDLPRNWHDTFDVALQREIQAHSEAITDVIMKAAFVSFSHEEVLRLTALGANPFLARFQAAKINTLYDPNPNVDAVRQMIATDPDFLALPPDDRALMGRLIKASEGSEALSDVMAPIVHTAVTEADATLELPPLGPRGRF